MHRLFALLLTAFALALGIAACGGDDGGGEDAQALLKQTFGSGHPIKSGKLDLALNLDLQGIPQLQGPIELRLAGPFQSNGAGKLPKFDFDLDVKTQDRPFSAGAISTGDKGFLTVEGQAFDVGDDVYASFAKGYEQAQQQSAKDESAAPSLSALGIDPARWLAEPETAGTEDVGGTETTHVTSAVDVPRFLDDLNRLLERGRGLQVQGAGTVPSPLTKAQRAQVQRAIKSAKVDVWTGKDDKTLRRLRLDVELDVPKEAQQGVGGLTGGRITFGFTIAGLNTPQQIATPKDPRPIGELAKAIQALAGTAQQGDTGTQTQTTPQQESGGANSGSAGGAQSQYFDCVNSAGSDVAKLQECATLLK